MESKFPESSDASSKIKPDKDMTPDIGLTQKVREYKRLYLYLMLTGIGILILVLFQLGDLFLTGKNAYHLAGSDLHAGDKFATDSSGKIIAFSSVAMVDSTPLISIFISTDSGASFEQKGEWKVSSSEGDLFIQNIQVAPDNKSILAVTNNRLLVRPAASDSFSVIDFSKIPAFPGDLSTEYSVLSFVPATDSVYLFDRRGLIYALDYKKPDSITTGKLSGLPVTQSIAFTPSGQLTAIGRTSTNGLVQRSYLLTNAAINWGNRYAVAAIKNNARREREGDTTVMVYPDSVTAYIDSSQSRPDSVAKRSR